LVLEQMTRLSIFVLLTTALGPATAFGQWAPTNATEEQPSGDASSTIVVIDSPPPQPSQPPAPTPGVVLERPGQVLLTGIPVRVQFRSPTYGVSFQLQVGGSYSSVSGVSFGMGWGWGYPGWGWGGWGWGYPGWGWGYPGWGVAPYYGEVVTRSYQPICEAPCQATLLSGRHRMALSLHGGKPVNIAAPVELTADSIVEGRYVDKSRLRKAGWATFIAGAVTGMALMFASIDYRYDPFVGDQIRYPPMFYTGVGLFASSIIAGAVLASQEDQAYANVYPTK
jgi:hypothetical protein